MAKLTEEKVIDTFDAILIIISITAYLLDTVTDILVAVLYFQYGHLLWACATAACIVIPSLAIQIFSARWYTTDQRGAYPGCWLVHLLQLQPLERYTMTLVAGLEARRYGDQAHIEMFYMQQNDVSMLRLIHAFLESAPQLTLQLYIVTATDCANNLTVGSACISLLALGWAVAAYSHALRQAYQSHYSRHALALFTQTLCHMLIAAARVASIVAFAVVFQYWVFLALGVHWLVMTIWIVLQKTDFCVNEVEEKFFDCIVGIIYCFNFFNLKEGRTRWRALAFYSVMCVENAAALVVWYCYKAERSWFDPLICVAVAIAFILGISFMMMYYCFCHPSQPFVCVKKKKPANTSLYMNSQTSTPHLTRHTTAKSIYSQKSPTAAIPQYTSASLLPRRTMLKPQPSTVSVLYKAVRTPNGLSPIKSPGNNNGVGGGAIAFRNKHSYNDCSFDWDDQLSGFQHYSVDATTGLRSFSHRISALQTSGIDLSREDLCEDATDADSNDVIDLEDHLRAAPNMDMGTFGVRSSPSKRDQHGESPYEFDRDRSFNVRSSPRKRGQNESPIRVLSPTDFERDRSMYSRKHESSMMNNHPGSSTPYDFVGNAKPCYIDNANDQDSLFDHPNDGTYNDNDHISHGTKKSTHSPYACVTEGCQRCGKTFPFMDQSMDNLADDTVGFCNCTLMGNLDDDQDTYPSNQRMPHSNQGDYPNNQIKFPSNQKDYIDNRRIPLSNHGYGDRQTVPSYHPYSDGPVPSNQSYIEPDNQFSHRRKSYDQSNDTSVTDSSGFYSRASNYGNGETVPPSVESSPGMGLSDEINAALPSRLKFINN